MLCSHISDDALMVFSTKKMINMLHPIMSFSQFSISSKASALSHFTVVYLSQPPRVKLYSSKTETGQKVYMTLAMGFLTETKASSGCDLRHYVILGFSKGSVCGN